jgi:hypothetical protein
MSDPNEYYIGQTIRITGTFSVAGTPTDPDTVTLTVKNPAGDETEYTYAAAQVAKSSTGVYYANVQLNKAGRWVYQWEGSGAVPASTQKVVICKALM